eukprot:gnl/MRDRNA2_/MRDRNA2_121894_c0_seq1.p1 gnl/MRDRNA2_/MRDRNA2_121894_c0~~gnl/MRDRNA2_/MRDRNA2_121894_c0_seq1.p1  ORF type:complete len:205 (-),score=43.40 gnl/MRDRNA2_/MRDRNA2_121894_c0_seq1:60-584(-)
MAGSGDAMAFAASAAAGMWTQISALGGMGAAAGGLAASSAHSQARERAAEREIERVSTDGPGVTDSNVEVPPPPEGSAVPLVVGRPVSFGNVNESNQPSPNIAQGCADGVPFVGQTPACVIQDQGVTCGATATFYCTECAKTLCIRHRRFWMGKIVCEECQLKSRDEVAVCAVQ